VESGVVAIVVLVILVGGSAVLLARQRTSSLSLPALRTSGAARLGVGEDSLAPDAALSPGSSTMDEPSLVAARGTARPTVGSPLSVLKREGPAAIPEPIRLDIPPVLSTPLMERLDQIESRLDELNRIVDRQHAESIRIRSDLVARLEAADARRDAALERLRADLFAFAADRQSGASDRRAEVSAELYARLARFESALAAVTNPILLPGEAYAPPAELQTEALIWDNWSEVGERAFALADVYSAQRLHLSEQTRNELGAFVTALRLLLTRSVYPNLQDDPDKAQQAALHAALEEIATELPNVRASLDREYREVRSP
jgi:hypothetical protein